MRAAPTAHGRPRWLSVAAVGVGVLLTLALATLLPQSAGAAPIAITTVSSKSYNSGTLVDMRVSSNEVDYPMREIFTWTPPLGNLDPQNLPVVYFLHGWPGSPASMFAGVTSQLLASFKAGAKPFIAAFPDGNAKTHIDSEWADSSDGAAMIESWLTTSAITAVEGSRIRSRDERAIVGFSMGGYGASMIALHHPDLYGQIVSLAGYFQVDDLTGAFRGNAKFAAQSPANFMNSAKKLKWFLAEAIDDYTLPIRGQMAAWSKKLSALKIPYVTNAPTGGHSFIFVAKEVPLFVKWFSWPILTPAQTPTPNSPTTAAAPGITPSPSPSPSATSTS